MHVLICGGGVLGASPAYFLSRRGVKATVIESAGPCLRRIGDAGRAAHHFVCVAELDEVAF